MVTASAAGSRVLAIRIPRASHASASSTASRSTDGRRSKRASHERRSTITRFLPPSLLVAILRRDLSRGYRDGERAAHSMDLYLRPFLSREGRDALIAHIRALTTDETRDLGEQLGRISAPTAIVWGQGDRVIPLWSPSDCSGDSSRHARSHPGRRATSRRKETPRQVADAIANLLTRR